METMQEVKWGDRIVKSRFVEIVDNNKPFRTDFNCDISYEYQNMGLAYQAKLQRQRNRIDYVESFGFRRLDERVIFEITRYYIAGFLKPKNVTTFYCNAGDIFRASWCAEGYMDNFFSGSDVRKIEVTLSSPWCLPIHATEQIPIIIARTLHKVESLFDMILISSTAHIKIVNMEVMPITYWSPVAIGKVGINSYLLAYWGDYPKFLEYPDFRIPSELSELPKKELTCANKEWWR